jgi:DNA polymerase-3 subunit delta
MRISNAQADKLVDNPDPALRAALLFGSDEGLVRERARRLTKSVAGDPSDPFRVAELSADDIAKDPALLSDEAHALSFTGGRRVVRVRGTSEGMTEILRALLDDASAEAMVIIEAGALRDGAALRKLCTRHDHAAAIACYPDDQAGLGRVIRDTLGEYGLRPTPDAMAFLRANLGSDRQVSRREIEKLALYAMGSRDVTLDDAAAVVGDSAAIDLDTASFAAAGGDHASLDRALSRLFLAGTHAVGILRMALRHLQRLHFAAAQLRQGKSESQAVAMLKPPVFFKSADEFRDQLRFWRIESLAEAIDKLLDAEIQCKSTGLPEEAVCSRALMSVANMARRERLRP